MRRPVHARMHPCNCALCSKPATRLLGAEPGEGEHSDLRGRATHGWSGGSAAQQAQREQAGTLRQLVRHASVGMVGYCQWGWVVWGKRGEGHEAAGTKAADTCSSTKLQSLSGLSFTSSSCSTWRTDCRWVGWASVWG